MSPKSFATMSGEQLWRLLPEIYRQRDNGDLASYLDAFGVLLDQVLGNLHQRLHDTSARECQAWLIPYFADLLDVRLVSPDIGGQREEVARAVDWRQRKGTVSVCIEIAEAVSRAPIIGFEGHRSVAITPSPGYRQPALRELGDEGFWRPGLKTPSELATYPGTPAVTVDFQKRSQPRRIDEKQPTPFTETSRFDDREIGWQHENPPHGLPCHLGGYRDVGMRTADMREPTWSVGHHHPKRFRLYTPVPEGFMGAEADAAKITATVAHELMTPMNPPGRAVKWIDTRKGDKGMRYLVRRDTMAIHGERPYLRIEERLLGANGDVGDNDSPELRIRATLLTLPDSIPTDAVKWHRLWRGNNHLFHIITNTQPETQTADASSKGQPLVPHVDDWDSHWHHNGFALQWERSFEPSDQGGAWRTQLRGGTWDITGLQPGVAGLPVAERDHLRYPIRWPTLTGDLSIDTQALVAGKRCIVDISRLTLVDSVTVKAQRTTLSELAVKKVTGEGPGAPAELRASDCLLYEVGGALGIVELECCTVHHPLTCEELRASDCILLGTLTANEAPKLKLRYSCVPHLDRSAASTDWIIHEASVHSRWPELHHQTMVGPEARILCSGRFGEPGYGVLKQAAHPSIRQGAEDGGELGAFHHRHYCGRQDAVADKLRDFLPVGMLPVLIVDEYWLPPIARKRLDGGPR